MKSQTEEGTTYTIQTVSYACLKESCSAIHCNAEECRILCRKQYHCNCFGYQTGHLCKHVHKLHTYLRGRIWKNSETALTAIEDSTEDNTTSDQQKSPCVSIPERAINHTGKIHCRPSYCDDQTCLWTAVTISIVCHINSIEITHELLNHETAHFCLYKVISCIKRLSRWYIAKQLDMVPFSILGFEIWS